MMRKYELKFTDDGEKFSVNTETTGFNDLEVIALLMIRITEIQDKLKSDRIVYDELDAGSINQLDAEPGHDIGGR
tara:strand:+ start:316 stop:540 length:225 start_codon:yes stop_codon:yes gene_type:complete